MADTTFNAAPVRYFNRYTKRLETEVIYGEPWLRWTYEHPVGRIALHLLVKRAWFSRWYGMRMDSHRSRHRILPFIQHYGLATHEFADPPQSFNSFNEFFFRRLKPEARPIDSRPGSIVFPADGRHLGFPDLSKAPGIFAKGQELSLIDLLQDPQLAQDYRQGTLILSRLCPVDYHRFHFPVGGIPGSPQLQPGSLYSVSPVALRRDLRRLVENRRWMTRLKSPTLGQVLLIEVGATNVGSAISTFVAGKEVKAGEEKGYFRFGGSLTITLFLPGQVDLEPDLVEVSAQGIELYAKMGDRMAVIRAFQNTASD